MLFSVLAITAAATTNVDVHDDPSLTYNYVALADWGNDSPGQYAAAAGLAAVAQEEVLKYIREEIVHLHI